MRWGYIWGLLMFCLGAPGVHGAFVLVDDFEAYSAGQNLSGVGGWATASSDQGTFAAASDPSGAANLVASHVSLLDDGTTGMFASKGFANTIANGTTGTLFFRFYLPGDTPTTGFNHGSGLSDVANPTSFPDFETQIQLAGTDPILRVRDGGAFDDQPAVARNQWFNVWMVADNLAPDNYDLYLNTGTSDATAGDLVGNFGFRNATAQPLQTVYLKLGATIDANLPVYYDDFYVDNQGANLAYQGPLPPAGAVPEPSILPLMLLAGLGLIRRRRRRRGG